MDIKHWSHAQVRIPDIETSVRVAKLDVHFKMQGLHISDLTIPMDLLTMDSHREGDRTVMRLTATSTAELENVEWALTTRLCAIALAIVCRTRAMTHTGLLRAHPTPRVAASEAFIQVTE